MCMHEHKGCPRCGAAFECKVGDISRCQCYNIKLNDAETEYISQYYQDCLCASCIKEMRAQYNQLQQTFQLKEFSRQR
jgi:hypothetical protein